MADEDSQVTVDIPIQAPYTLDKYWDPAEPTGASGSLQTLTNYIPKKKSIETRLGIVEFSFT